MNRIHISLSRVASGPRVKFVSCKSALINLVRVLPELSAITVTDDITRL